MTSLLAFTMPLMLAVSTPPIYLYDLTPTISVDLKDPAKAARVWDEAHTVATLQGIVNRNAPRLYLRAIECHGVNVDDYWRQKLSAPGEWLAGREWREIKSLSELVETFRKDIKGVVLYDPQVASTSLVASAVAGADDLIAIRYDPAPNSVYTRLVAKGPKLPVVVRLVNEDGTSSFTGQGTIPGTHKHSTGSAKCDAYIWLKVNYLDTGKLNATYVGHYMDAYWLRDPLILGLPNLHMLTNHDFIVAKRGWFFDLLVWGDETPIDDREQAVGTDLKTLQSLLLSAYNHGGKDDMIHICGMTPWASKYTTYDHAGGTHDPVPTEWELVRLISAYNGFLDADALAYSAMANASFFMHAPLKKKYPQRWVTHDELKQRGYLTADGKVDFKGRQFFIFYVGDYDAAAWVYQQSHRVWDDPGRGNLPLMWCISPVLERRAPMALDYFRRTATPNDYFAGTYGAGYLCPGMLQEPRPTSGLPSGLKAWERLTAALYDRWSLTISGFIIDGLAPGLNEHGLESYSHFSPNGIVPQKVPGKLLYGDMPILPADHNLTGHPDSDAQLILTRLDKRSLPFHWIRGILLTPTYYEQLYNTVREKRPDVELLDAPTFFELYRIYLKNNPKVAAGDYRLEL